MCRIYFAGATCALTMNQKTNEPDLMYFPAPFLRLNMCKLIMTFMTLGMLPGPTLAPGSEESEVIGSHEPIGAVVGEDVILPCHLEPPFDVTNLRVEWKFSGSFVHVYRSRMDDAALQDPKFQNRTSLFHNKMHTGNISLKLTNVTLTDAGKYICFVPKLQSQVKRGYISLTVADARNDTIHDPGTEPSNNYSGPIIGAALGVVGLIIVYGIWRMWKHKSRDGHNMSNTDKRKEQVPLNTTNSPDNPDNPDNADNVDNPDNADNVDNPDNADDVDNLDNADKTEHIDNVDNVVNTDNIDEDGQY